MVDVPVLVIEDNREIAQQVSQILAYIGLETLEYNSHGEWSKHFGTANPPYVVLLGSCGGTASLLDIFQEIKAADPYTPLLLLVPPGEEIPDTEELDNGVLARVDLPLRQAQFREALQKVEIYRENRHQGATPRSIELFRNLVGSSKGIQRVRNMIEMVSRSDANVLIVGESGTGKEVVARHIHHSSPRRSKPFVPINCGAIPADLLESELFGHEKGAFTGAIATRQGRFEMANGGSLFLDEIGDMTLSMQIKLLRVLQERTFERVGSNKSISVNVRIIAATHVNLEKAIEQGKFREDLYYRLNVFPIDTPPLNERSEDLPLLVNDLVERLDNEGRGSIRLTAACIESLSYYSWPGNVRELANLIERLSILYPNGVIDVQDLPDKYRSPEVNERSPVAEEGVTTSHEMSLARLPRTGLDLKEHLNNIEASLVEQALKDTDWVVAHAAKRLHMGRTTLVEKMRKLGLNRQDEVTEL